MRAAGDHLGALPADPVVARQAAVAVEALREHHRVFECLAGSLAEVGSHGVRGVAHKRHPAGDIGLELRQLIQVVVQDRIRFRRLQQGGDGAVPRAETAAQPDQSRIRRAFGRVGDGEAVDPPVTERGVAEALA